MLFYEPSIFDDQISILEQFEALKQYVIGFDPGTGGTLPIKDYNFTLNNVVTIGSIPYIMGTLITTYENDTFRQAPFQFPFAITGSDTIVVDVSETNNGIEIHLDADIVNKIQRMLLAPVTPPSEISVVAIDTNGNQILLALGDGLEIQDGKIVATGGGDTPSGTTTVDLAGQILTTTSPNPVLCFSTENQKIYFEGEEENGITDWWMQYSYATDYLKPLLGAPTPTESGVALTAGETYYYTFCTSDPSFAILVIQNDVKTWVTDAAGQISVTWNNEQSVNMQSKEFTTSGSFLGLSVTNDPNNLYIPYGTNEYIGQGTPDYFVYYLMESGDTPTPTTTTLNLYNFDGSELLDTFETTAASPVISWTATNSEWHYLNFGTDQYYSESPIIGLSVGANNPVPVLNAGTSQTLTAGATYNYYLVTAADVAQKETTVILYAPQGNTATLIPYTFKITTTDDPYLTVNDGFGAGAGVALTETSTVTEQDLDYSSPYYVALGLAATDKGSVIISLDAPTQLTAGQTYTYYLRYEGDIPTVKTTTLKLYVPTSSAPTYEMKTYTTTESSPIVYVDDYGGAGGRVFFGAHENNVWRTVNYPVIGLSTTPTNSISINRNEGRNLTAGSTYIYYVRISS